MAHRKQLPLVFMVGVIASGMVISFLAIYLVSQQKNARLLNIQNELTRQLGNIRDMFETRTQELIDQVYQFTLESANRLPSFYENPETLLSYTKSLVLDHPVIQYPFFIDSHRCFLFPGYRKAVLPGTMPSAINDISMKPNVKASFLKAYELEFIQKNNIAAIKAYNETLHENPTPSIRPYIYNAIARCYRKLNRFPQAIYYYQEILQHGVLHSQDPLLYYTTLRQIALCYRLTDSLELAVQYYLRLYDELQKPKIVGDSYEFYKNEALAFLNHYARPGQKQNLLLNTHTIKQLQNTSELDIALTWIYFEVEEPQPGNPHPENDLDSSKFLKLKDLYETDDQKTQFYQAVKNSVAWDKVSNSGMSHQEISLTGNPGLENHAHIVIYPLVKEHDTYGTVYFGFMISPEIASQQLLPGISQSFLHDPALYADFFIPGKTTLCRVPFKSFFPGRTLALYSSSDNTIERMAQRDIRLYYILLIAFIITLELGTFFFYQYMTRERQLVQLKSQFIASASHTLKTPLTRISLLAENIASGWVTDESHRQELLRKMISETTRMGEMIDNLLNFSHIEERRKIYRPGKTYLQEIADEILEQYSLHLQHHGFEVKTDIDGDLPALNLDPGAGRLILGNLFQNSIKYSLKEKYIHLRLFQESSEAVLIIQDRGMGIPANDIPHIFKKFSRAMDERINAIEGSGLGLYLVRHAIEAHGGRIDVTSEINKGTTFTIRFPLPSRNHSPQKKKKSSPSPQE